MNRSQILYEASIGRGSECEHYYTDGLRLLNTLHQLSFA